jgi:hypothetical protein
MKQNVKDNSSRRRFLSLGLLGGAGLLTQKAEAMTSLPEDDEKIQMLTADGKLVEVSKRIFEQSETREKVRNQDILNWSDSAHKTKP